MCISQRTNEMKHKTHSSSPNARRRRITKCLSLEDNGAQVPKARSRRVGRTPQSEPMRGSDAPRSYHQTFGKFLGTVGGRMKIAPLGVAGGKHK